MKYYPPRFLFRRHELLRRIKPGHSFLEIGPGSLNLTGELVHRFSHGVLVDCNPDVAPLFEKCSYKDRLSLHIAEFSDLHTDEKFDLIVACEVLEHIEDHNSALSGIYNSLMPGGTLALSVPARMKYWSVHDETVGHLRRYEKSQLEDILGKAGFTDIDIVSYGYPWVNILRLMRVALARKQQKQLADKTVEQKTKESGLSHYKIMNKLFGIIVNKITILPYAYVSSIFNNGDMSNGYIAIARRL